MDVISSHCFSCLLCQKPQREVAIRNFFFVKKWGHRIFQCCTVAGSGVSFISFPSIHRGKRNKECPPIQVMKFISWMYGSEVQLIDTVSWQKRLIRAREEIFELKAGHSEPQSGVFCTTTWKLWGLEMSEMKCLPAVEKHQSEMSRWLFHLALVKGYKIQKGQMETISYKRVSCRAGADFTSSLLWQYSSYMDFLFFLHLQGIYLLKDRRAFRRLCALHAFCLPQFIFHIS